MHYGNPPWYIAQGLLELRKRIAAARIPSSALDETLNLATWNIREFGKKPRLDPSIYFIAEILNQFDLIALVELRDDLEDLGRVMDRLGSRWEVVFSDFIEDPGGNTERIAYLFDTRMVRFTGLAAEADPPRAKNAAGEYLPEFNWWRAPYMASFEAGGFDFVVMTAHIRWGKKTADRLQELTEFRGWIERRRNAAHQVDRDFIVMGDFNIPSRRSATYTALIGDQSVLQVPERLLGVKGTNLEESATYDQILHSPSEISRFSGDGGSLPFHRGGWQGLYPDPAHAPKDDTAFTFELSDHLPLWLQVQTDIIEPRMQLLSKKRGKASR